MSNAKIDKTQIKELQEKCKTDLRFLAKYVCGLTYWEDSLHNELVQVIQGPEKKKLILMPRGHLKSSIVTVAWVIQQLLINPNIRILITNSVWDRAREFLGQISALLTHGSLLPQIFGSFEGPTARFTQNEITIAQKTNTSARGPSIRTAGSDSALAGSHCDILVHDDLVEESNINTSDQIQKIIRYYQNSLDLLDPGGIVIVIGTRWAMPDLYGHIMNKEMTSFNGHLTDVNTDVKWRDLLKLPSKIGPDQVHPTTGFAVYLRQMVEQDRVIFPGKPDVYGFCQECREHQNGEQYKCLQCLRRSKTPHSVSSQYFNDPIDADSVEFKSHWNREFIYTEELLKTLSKTRGLLSIDPAFTLTQTNDEVGMVVTKMPNDGLVYVLEALGKHMNPDDLVKETFRLVRLYNIYKVLLETNSSQIIFMKLFKAEMVKQKFFFQVEETPSTTRESKAMKIRGLIPYYSNGQVLHRKGLAKLEAQLIQFPHNVHDDVIDALANQVKHWQKMQGKEALQGPAPMWSLDWWKRQDHSGEMETNMGRLFGDLM